MAGKTTVIFLTSDEDLVRQLSSTKSTKTHIIDLDDGEQVTSTLQIPKRNRSKQVKLSKKSNDLICIICGDRAIGFNYDVLSCASCKAFFYRYARQDSTKLKCLKDEGQCLIECKTSRKCHRCRLERCFSMGMRKDFILSEEKNHQRRKHAEENQNISLADSSRLTSSNSSVPNSESLSQIHDQIDSLLMDVYKDDDENTILNESINSNEMKDSLLGPLTAEDLVVIDHIQSSFVSIFENQCEEFVDLIDLSDRSSALISWSQFVHLLGLRLISFFRLIDEFESLHEDDRFILIKYHLLHLLPFLNCYTYRSTNDCCSYGEHEEAQKKRRFFMLCDQSKDVHKMFIDLILFLVQITEQDQVLLSLLFIIILFSQGLSMNNDEPLLKDSLSINRVQSYYTKVLWNYMVNKQGETKASKQFTQLVMGIFRIQSGVDIFREFFRFQITTSATVDRIAPLLQTILHIS